MPSPSSIQLFLVDDHDLVRAGLKAMFADYSHLSVIGEAGNIKEALDRIPSIPPDVVLLDVSLPDGEGFEICRQLKPQMPNTRFLMLTSYMERTAIAQSIAAGAHGYLLKAINSQFLVECIERIHGGERVIDPRLMHLVFDEIQKEADPTLKMKLQSLTPQEIKVLRGVSQGLTNKEIGLELKLSEKTVKNYFSTVLSKLDMTRRSEAAAFFARHFEKD
jgi:DNA-binding NarL/FixJ family response regulator